MADEPLADNWIIKPEGAAIGWTRKSKNKPFEAPLIPQPSVESIINANIELLWASADSYVKGYISGVAVGILTIGVIQNKPKAMAVTAWSNAIWSDYYLRKNNVNADDPPNLDFSMHGVMPHTVPELQEEVGL